MLMNAILTYTNLLIIKTMCDVCNNRFPDCPACGDSDDFDELLDIELDKADNEQNERKLNDED